MGRGKVILYPQVQKKLEDLGHRIKLARLRRFLAGAVLVSSAFPSRETLIQSLSDFTLEFLYMTKNNPTRIASY